MSSSVSFTRGESHNDEHPDDTHDGSTEDESGSETSGDEDAKPKRPALSRAATLHEEDENFQAIVDTLQSWAKKRPAEKRYEWDLSPAASDGEAGKTSDTDSDNSVMRKSVRFNESSKTAPAPTPEPVAASPEKTPLHRTPTGFFDPAAANGATSETVSKTRKAKLEYLRRTDSNVSEKPEKGAPKPTSVVVEKPEKVGTKPFPIVSQKPDRAISKPIPVLTKTPSNEAPKPTPVLAKKVELEAPKPKKFIQKPIPAASEEPEKEPPKPIEVVVERKGAFLNKLAAFQSKNDPPLKPKGIVAKTAVATKKRASIPKTVELEPTPLEKPSKPSKAPAPEPAGFKLTIKPVAPKALAESYYDNVQGIEEREKEVTENLEQVDNNYRPSKSQSSAFANARKLFSAAKESEEPPKPVQSVRPKKVIKVNTQAFEKH
uniref:Protein lap4 n=1 Tax=Panagrellus redivivus TaxID=6233 RepID=A0A7E4VED5_PANRE